jgi:plasmid replication initiation protein
VEGRCLFELSACPLEVPADGSLVQADRLGTSARLLASFESLGDEVGTRRSGVAAMNETTVAAIHTQLDDAAVAEAWEQGRKLTVGEAVTLALDSETGFFTT